MVSIIIKEWTTKIELVPAVQKRNAAVLLRKPGRLASQSATGCQYGQRLTWRAFTDATCPISLHRLDEACPDCQWLALCKEIAAARMEEEPALLDQRRHAGDGWQSAMKNKR